MARIAIGIPVFNEEAHIASTLTSVLGQFNQYSDLEILLADNASTDKTLEKVEATLEANPRGKKAVTITRHAKNGGPADNFWHVFDGSDSDYFLWVGAHDQLSEGYVAEAVQCLDMQSDTSMFCGTHKKITPSNEIKEHPIRYDFSQPNPAERYLRSIAQLTNCYIFHSVFRRHSLDGFVRESAPSLDHVMISRWLWSGRLVQSPRCFYLRRYFSIEDRQAKTERGDYVNRQNNVEFFQAYIDDLERVASDLPNGVKEMLIRQAGDLLVKRFGIPYWTDN